jgi:hypothetical protein
MNFRTALLLAITTSPALAQQITSRAELETILDDQILLEDFESLSLHSGSSLDLPNPLNETTAMSVGFGFEILPGITYRSPKNLNLYSGFINGEEDLYLRATNALTITFHEPQIAFGFDLYATDCIITIHSRNNTLIDLFMIPANTFFGYQDPNQGIESVVIMDASSTYTSVNNVAYGAVFTPCPADINNDDAHNFLDVSAFLTHFANEDDRADFTDDGQFNFLDVSLFLTAFAAACP